MRIRRMPFLAAAVLLMAALCPRLQAEPLGVFDVGVQLVDGYPWFDGIGYIWKYQVCASEDTNRGLSHWTLSICDEQDSWHLGEEGMLYFDLSFFDGSDPYFYTTDRGVRYRVEFGDDPSTGLRGIKFEHDDDPGTQIGDTLTCDTFAFRLTDPFDVVIRDWRAKGGTIIDTGSVEGPACVPSETPPPVPEPATLLLLGLGVVGAGAVARRRGRATPE